MPRTEVRPVVESLRLARAELRLVRCVEPHERLVVDTVIQRLNYALAMFVGPEPAEQ